MTLNSPNLSDSTARSEMPLSLVTVCPVASRIQRELRGFASPVWAVVIARGVGDRESCGTVTWLPGAVQCFLVAVLQED